jgi:Carbohydrate family 9 binding domain-like
MRAVLAAMLAFAGAAAGCVDKGAGPQGKQIDPKLVTANLISAVPADLEHLDVVLGGVVTYVGTKVDRPVLAPGQGAKVIHCWRFDRAPGPGWRVFAFVRGAPGTADFMNLDETDMELGHPVDAWKPGELVQDPRDLVLRPDWKSRTATLYVGLVHVGGHGTGDRMEATGPNTFDRAVVARTFDVDLSKAPPPPGTIHVSHANGAITIDGSGLDPGWANAVTSPEFQTAEGSPEPVGKATAKLSWDEDNLYVLVQVIDSDIYSTYKKHDDPLWKADAVELFIDADGNRRGYVELQVNPNNATFDSWFATTRAQPGDESWDSGMITAVKVRGTADKAGDTDQGWDVEIAIPWAAVKGRDAAMKINTPPHVGDRWRLNVVRVDTKTGSKDVSASSWNRIGYGDFHALDRMLNVVFADRTGSITPTAAPAPDDGAGEGSGTPGQVPAAGVVPAGAGSAAKVPALVPVPATVVPATPGSAPGLGHRAPGVVVPAPARGSASPSPVERPLRPAPATPAVGSAGPGAAKRP